MPNLLGGIVAPNPRFWPWLVRCQIPVATNLFLRSVRNKYGPRAWSRFPLKSTLLVLDGDGIDRVLALKQNFAHPFVKRRPVSRFTPSGAVISRHPQWTNRRDLNTHVLAFGRTEHPDGNAFIKLVNEKVERLLDTRREMLVWDDFSALAARISQQVIFGRGEYRTDFAKNLGRLVSRSNYFFRRYPDYWSFFRRIDEQLERQAQTHDPDNSLVCEAARWVAEHSGAHDAEASSQAAFWLFVMKDAIELHTVRTLALIASASDDVRQEVLTEVRKADPAKGACVGTLKFLEACIKEQLRLWTPVPILLRVATEDFTLCDIDVRAGQQILMHVGFYHRDPEVFGAVADRFSPEKRVLIDKANDKSVTNSDPPLYVFSQYQRSCAGEYLAIFLLKAVLAALIRRSNFVLLEQSIDTNAVPAAIDPFALRFWRRPHHV